MASGSGGSSGGAVQARSNTHQLRPWAPAGSDSELVPEDTVQPPGLEYRLGMGADGQRYARWPAGGDAEEDEWQSA
jgi:hypothetical protein